MADGIVIIFVREPVASVVPVVVEPSGSVIVTVELGAKPVSDMVTVLPAAPLAGDATVLAFTVNVEPALGFIPSLTDMV